MGCLTFLLLWLTCCCALMCSSGILRRGSIGLLSAVAPVCAACANCGASRSVSTRPVLKHGPRSLTHTQVARSPFRPVRRNENKLLRNCRTFPVGIAIAAGLLPLSRDMVELEAMRWYPKMVNYAGQDEARGNSGGGL